MVVSNLADFVSNADRAGVAHPAAIGGHTEKIHRAEIGAGFFQDGANARFGGAVFDKKMGAFHLRQMTDDLRKRPRDGRKFSGPIRYLVRPAEPGGFMAFPFGGHAEAEGARRFDGRRRFHWPKEFNTEVTPPGSGQAPSAENTEKTQNEESSERQGHGKERTTVCPASGSGWVDRRRCGGRAAKARCGEVSSSSQGRIRPP